MNKIALLVSFIWAISAQAIGAVIIGAVRLDISEPFEVFIQDSDVGIIMRSFFLVITIGITVITYHHVVDALNKREGE